MIPLLVLAFGFGLSMDYEVFLLSRIVELHEQGRPTTSGRRWGCSAPAASSPPPRCSSSSSSAASSRASCSSIKETGVALAFAVAVDATLVRMLLVPATMTLLGRWNWWAPAPLRRLHERTGSPRRACRQMADTVRVLSNVRRPARRPRVATRSCARGRPVVPGAGRSRSPGRWRSSAPRPPDGRRSWPASARRGGSDRRCARTWTDGRGSRPSRRSPTVSVARPRARPGPRRRAARHFEVGPTADDWEWLWTTTAPPPGTPTSYPWRPRRGRPTRSQRLLAVANPRPSATRDEHGVRALGRRARRGGRLVACAAHTEHVPGVPHLASVAAHPRGPGSGPRPAVTGTPDPPGPAGRRTRRARSACTPDNDVARRHLPRLGYAPSTPGPAAGCCLTPLSARPPRHLCASPRAAPEFGPRIRAPSAGRTRSQALGVGAVVDA